MIPPTSIDGTDITGATIDGTDVQEITVDGDVVFTSGGGVSTPPPDASNLIANYDALAITGLSDGQVVNTWADQSGNNRDMSPDDGTDPRYETNEINGNPAVEGQSDYFADGNFLPNAYTYYLVYKQNGGSQKTAYATYQSFGSFINGAFTKFDLNGIVTAYGNGSTGVQPLSTFSFNPQDGNPHVLTVGVDADNGIIVNRVDGDEDVLTNLTTLTISHGDLYLMTGENVKGRSFDGFQAQNLFYDGLHDATTRASVEAFLASKWGITI